MKSAYARVSSKGQLVIPATLRKKFGIEAGTLVKFVEERQQLVLVPETPTVKLKTIKGVRGMTAGKPSVTELFESSRLERERELREEVRRTSR
jgi:AbrB family looped-hinge helix DNA binding protein